jgi:hypothetical protein
MPFGERTIHGRAQLLRSRTRIALERDCRNHCHAVRTRSNRVSRIIEGNTRDAARRQIGRAAPNGLNYARKSGNADGRGGIVL